MLITAWKRQHCHLRAHGTDSPVSIKAENSCHLLFSQFKVKHLKEKQLEITSLNKSKIVSRIHKIKEQVHSVRVLVRRNDCFMKEGKEKKTALWISKTTLAGVGGEQGEGGIKKPQVAVTCASCFKKLGEHLVWRMPQSSICERCFFLSYSKGTSTRLSYST